MAAPIEFNIRILGGAAGELGKVGDGFTKADQHARKAAEGVSAFDAEIGHLGGSVGGLTLNLGALAKGGSIFTFDLAEGAQKVIEVVTEAVEKFAEWTTEIIKVGGAAQDLNLALRLNTGEASGDLVESIIAGLRGTRLEEAEIKRDLLPFLEAGNKDQGLLFDLETAANDIAARRADPAARSAALAAFQKISLKGEVDARALRELAIGEADYFNALGGILGVSAEQAKQLSSKGKVQSQTLLNVALGQIAAREGGALGVASEQEGGTLGASLKRLADLKENLFRGAADSPGLKSVQHAIDAFVEFAEGPVGKGLIDRIAAGVGQLADKVLVFIGSEEGQRKIGDAIDYAATAVERFVSGAAGVIQFFADVAPVIEIALKPFTFIAGLMIDIEGLFIQAGTRFWLLAHDIGTAIWQGLRDGVMAGIDAVGDAIGGVADRAKRALGIASPSQVFFEIGGYTAEGFRLGMEGRESDIDATANRIFSRTVIGAAQAPASLPGAAPAPAAGRDLPPISIVVNGARQPVETAVEVRVQLRQLLVELGLGLGMAA